MSQVKYMELNSNYRNRNMFPSPGSFEVGISQSGMKTNTYALDPVSHMYPESVFRIADFGSTNFKMTGFNPPPPSVSLGHTSASSVFILEDNTSGTFTVPIKIDGYYNGAVITFKASIDKAPSGYTLKYTYRRRILAWNVMGDKFKVTIEGTIPDNMFLGEDPITQILCDIQNPSVISTPSPFVFLPASISVDNYYNKYVIWNQTKGYSIPILSFDKVTHIAQLGDLDTLTLDTSDVLSIRKVAPYKIGVLQTSSITDTHSYNISQEVSDQFVNSFIRLYKTTDQTPILAGNVNPNANIIRRIIRVSKTTPSYSIVLDEPIPAGVPADYNYEILDFSTDNYSPFIYTGSLVSQSQPVAHEITLNSLILPNVPLKNGGRIAYYPYVYVELENVSSSGSSSKNVIYSNNPNVRKAIFKVPITDLNHPSVSPFVKLTGNGMKQTVTFKQNDNMRVSVHLPNGSEFLAIKNDTSYGAEPDPFLQISLCFGMERI
jgi:hypothetical protein